MAQGKPVCRVKYCYRINRGDYPSNQTQSEAFKRWFGDSKVVNDQGNPLVVYHGTDQEFSVFNTDYGAYFTSDKSVGKRYTDRAGGKKVMSVYLSIKNPLVIEADGDYWSRVNVGGFQADTKTIDKIFPTLKSDYDAPSIVSAVKNSRLGYDGIIFNNLKDAPIGRQRKSNVYVAFMPEQIKSATGNRSTVDPENPKILNETDEHN